MGSEVQERSCAEALVGSRCIRRGSEGIVYVLCGEAEKGQKSGMETQSGPGRRFEVESGENERLREGIEKNWKQKGVAPKTNQTLSRLQFDCARGVPEMWIEGEVERRGLGRETLCEGLQKDVKSRVDEEERKRTGRRRGIPGSEIQNGQEWERRDPPPESEGESKGALFDGRNSSEGGIQSEIEGV